MLNNYYECREWLESFIPLVYGKEELGLLRIENLLGKLGNPHKKYKSILIAGTSGKGTTAFYTSRILEFAGYKVGLHVSPHLVYVGERMQINGKNISVKRLVGLVNEIKPVIDEIKSNQPQITPSYFEILVAISFLYFADEKVDFAVIEVGLGGRLDATNVLLPEVSVITNIGLDHTEILGKTIEKIAEEKAGIIRTHVPVVTAASGNALKVIKKVAKSKGARLINIYTQAFENLQNSDVLRYIINSNDIYRYIPYYINSECALLAISAVLELKIPLFDESLKKALSVQFAGRFEEIEQGVILDGAHNADKMKTLIHFVKNYKSEVLNSKITLVVAFKTGKDWKKMLDILTKKLPVKKVIAAEYQSVTDTGKGSAVPAAEIAKYLSGNGHPAPVIETLKNSQEAVFRALNERTDDETVIVTGSLYLVGEARTLWKLPEF